MLLAVATPRFHMGQSENSFIAGREVWKLGAPDQLVEPGRVGQVKQFFAGSGFLQRRLSYLLISLRSGTAVPPEWNVGCP